jgi:integrase
MKLTQRAVDGLSEVAKPTTYFDDDLKGFGVRLRPPSGKFKDGARVWIVEYRPGVGGRGVAKKRIVLGPTVVLSAANARDMAKDMLAGVRRGEDPAEARSELRQAPTLKELVARYQAEAGAGRKPRTKELYESLWRLHVLTSDLAGKKAREITRADIARLHRKIGAGHETTANRAMVLLQGFYQWAGRIGAVPEGINPARGVEKYREGVRERFLTPQEIERLSAALHEAETVGIEWEDKPRSKHAPKKLENRRTKVAAPDVAAIRLLMLTGCRLREILHLRWSEVDLGRGLLLLPDSKTGRKTIVLSSAALAVIADLDKVSDFVIPGQPKPAKSGEKKPEDKPRADLHRPWKLVSRRAGLRGVRIHDLRHTFASFGAAQDLGLQSIGRLLGHASTKTTERYAHLSVSPLRRASELISGEIAAALDRGKQAAGAKASE